MPGQTTQSSGPNGSSRVDRLPARRRRFVGVVFWASVSRSPSARLSSMSIGSPAGAMAREERRDAQRDLPRRRLGVLAASFASSATTSRPALGTARGDPRRRRLRPGAVELALARR